MTTEHPRPPSDRVIDEAIQVTASREQAWQAVSTGDGLEAWFVPGKVMGGQGGTIMLHFGPGLDGGGVIEVWEPGERMRVVPRPGEEEHGQVVEFRVEAEAGGACTVRVVNYGWGEGWEDQFDSVRDGWRRFLSNLKLYLEFFGGQPCRQLHFMGVAMAPPADAWARLVGDEGLGIGGQLDGLALGDRLRAVPPSGEPIEGQVDVWKPGVSLGLRLDTPGPGLVRLMTMSMGGMTGLSVMFYLYGDGRAGADALEEQWGAWFGRAFPMPQMPTSPV